MSKFVPQPKADRHLFGLACGIVCVCLVLAVAALYAPTGAFDFVNYDDDLCVYQNPHVNAGLSTASVEWAFTSVSLFYWQPLVWLSHMLVCQFFGLNPGPHHLVNAGLHAINAVLLFLLLLSMTRAFWRSAIAAGIFAFHPLRVESVAWIAERKDVLSGLAWLVTLWTYYFYTKKKSRWRYLLLLAAFALGLMTKPVLMTLPVVCLVLDYWPLKRWQPNRKAAWSLIREKIPLLFISLASILLTLYGLGKMRIIVDLPWSARLANAVYAYCTYLGRTIWPTNLTLLIPYRLKIPISEILLYFLALLAITTISFACRKRYPYLFSGWLWFVIAQAPIVGLVQSGPQSIQDHFTYLPSIGIVIGIVWFIAETTQPKPVWRFAAAGFAVVVMAWFAYQTSRQLPVWRNSVTLFTQASEAAPQSAVVQHNLGFALATEGRYADAIPRYVLALQLDPMIFQAHYNLGRAFYATGKLPDSIEEFRQALAYPLAPAYEADVRDALGIALTQAGDLNQAQNQFVAAHNLEPLSPEINANLGSFLARTGNLEQAATFYRNAIQQSSGFTEAHLNLGRVLMALGKRDEALEQFQIVLLQAPSNVEARTRIDQLDSHRQ